MDIPARSASAEHARHSHQDPSLAPDLPFRALDHAKEAFIARLTSGLSPAALLLALADWGIHLAAAPGKQLELAASFAKALEQMANYSTQLACNEGAPTALQPTAGDSRFRSQAWQSEPYRYWQQAFLLAEQWWRQATRDVPGTTHHHEDMVSFGARQWLDLIAPSNFPFTNPDVASRTASTFGANLLKGAGNAFQDVQRQMSGLPAVGLEKFVVGENLAVTPGKVVFRNHLIELIQYTPATRTVRAEPVLIVPAWIMKYYILDLSPHNSLIRYLVGQGHTVFCISWRNVTAQDRNLSLEDYRRDGVMAALDAVSEIVPQRKIHATGYCLGGTLLSIAAAAMATAGDARLATLSLFAAQTDFTEPGELQLFIDDIEVYFLESMMWSQGYLSARQMSGAFQWLRSNELIWSRIVHDYLLGERTQMTDMMAWNADSTRMPYRMHSEYLHHLFLDNDLAFGRYRVDGRAVALSNVRVPAFVVGTEYDHIAPWRSVYKIHTLLDADVTFVLTNGGHNAGIVSEPGHAHRHFRYGHTAAHQLRVGPDEWVAAHDPQDGSWWPAWTDWLKAHSAPKAVTPPPLGAGGASRALPAAPGTYVLQK